MSFFLKYALSLSGIFVVLQLSCVKFITIEVL
jgi:hypothetical protein